MNTKARGSALIIAFLLIAAVGSASLVIGRLFLVDQSVSQVYEDSIVAYYAAESGIEEALLRYRYDNNVQVPSNQRLVVRSNLADSVASISNPTNAIPIEADQRYDLKVSSYGNYFGEDPDGDGVVNLTDPNDYYKIPQDEAIKVDITNIVEERKDFNLYVKLPSGTNKRMAFIEVKIVGKEVPGGNLKEYKKALIFQSGHDIVSGNSKTMTYVPTNRNFALSSLKSIIVGASSLVEAELSIKPLYSDIFVVLQPQTGSSIAQSHTLIKSTGYYGRNSRTLSAKIDRQNGTVYDLFDYVLYDKKD